jgi:GH43 family beta-xylosidase
MGWRGCYQNAATNPRKTAAIKMNIFDDRRPMYGQDPFVTMVDDVPLLIESIDEEKIAISPLDSLHSPQRKDTIIVWDDEYEHQVWAPELHHVDGLWYIFYAASDGNNKNHRNYVLQAPHPFGPYWKIGAAGPDIWGIDMTRFDWWDGNSYAVWSGWEKNDDEFPQNLYIARMYDPITLGMRVKLSVPEYDWEKSIAPILEGPQVCSNHGGLALLYSANASWKQEYSTGILTFVGSDPLNPSHWQKNPNPLYTNAGHGCIVDGYFIHHRKISAFPGWTDREIVSIKLED